MADENQKMGVEWGYLKTLLNLYNEMVIRYGGFLRYINGLGHSNEKKLFFTSISSYYTSVKFNFDKFLSLEKDNVKADDYINFKGKTDDEILKLYLVLCEWSQSQGPFKTMVEKYGIHDAFKH